jgi:hypothetical protein
MKKIMKYACSMALVIPLLSVASFADNLQWNLPYGLGSLQLPWQSTEVLYGYVRPVSAFKSGLGQEIAGASLPVITIGKLKSGYRLLDGQVGAVGSWPVQGAFASPYLAVGHDFVQDISSATVPVALKSAHLNGALTYLTNLGGWYAGGTASYAFWGPSPVAATSTAFLPKPAYLSKLNLYNPLLLS